jgi:aminoglycoside 6'-N-acetyltransferase I
MLTIKTLTPGDLPLLLIPAEDVFDNPMNESYTREVLSDPRHHIVAAIDDGLLVGFASAVHYIHPDKPPELWINEVVVAPAHQGKGIGKKIMREMLKVGIQLGWVNAWVLTDRNNSTANGLYSSLGGKISGEETVVHEFETIN